MAVHWTMILNPRAGGGRSRQEWTKISGALDNAGVMYTIMQTDRRDHATYLVQEAIRTGARHILSVGGDGTANEVVNGILGQKVVPQDLLMMAHIGAGTGNDWGRSTGFPTSYLKAAEAIRAAIPTWVDAGVIRYSRGQDRVERHFVNMAGLGFGAFAGGKLAEGGGGGGSMKYLSTLLSSLFQYQSTSAKWWVDGEEHQGSVFTAAVGNGRFNGGGMMQAPDASLTDGLLDLTVIGHMGKLEVIRNLGRLYKGTFVNHPAVKQYKGRHFRIEGNPPLPFECDGEILGSGPVEFEVSPRAFKLVMS